jgi:hypothetical protein
MTRIKAYVDGEEALYVYAITRSQWKEGKARHEDRQ